MCQCKPVRTLAWSPYFRTMGAVAWVLDAKERLEVMHSIFHPDGEPFQFDWKWLAPSGLSTKDFIAPSSFRFGNARMFGLGGKYECYINKLCTRTLYDSNGIPYVCVDEYMKRRLEIKLIHAIVVDLK